MAAKMGISLLSKLERGEKKKKKNSFESWERKKLRDMDGVMNMVGTYMFQQKAGKQLSSVSNEINSIGDNIEGGAKWLVNKVKGKVYKPLPDLLKEYDLPIGLFPMDTTSYDFKDDTKKLTVHMPNLCEVRYKDSSFLRFSTVVTGFLEKGRMYDIEGVKTKIVIGWPKVSCVMTEGASVHFQTTIKRTTRERNTYEALRDSVGIEKF